MQLIITRMNQLNMHVSDLLEQKKKMGMEKENERKSKTRNMKKFEKIHMYHN